MLHPEVAFRDCQTCLKFAHHESGENFGEVAKDRRGEPLERPPGTYPPCHENRPNDSCPKGRFDNPTEVTPQTWKAFQFHRECKMTGDWPDDRIVRENGIQIEELLDLSRSKRQAELLALEVAKFIV